MKNISGSLKYDQNSEYNNKNDNPAPSSNKNNRRSINSI